jgi:hypothetical protein
MNAELEAWKEVATNLAQYGIHPMNQWNHHKGCGWCDTLKQYNYLINKDDDDYEYWREIADDLYISLQSYPSPVPQHVTNAITRYVRRKENRF